MQSVVKSAGLQIGAALTPLQSFRQRLVGFLFPFETDTWLAVLRSGLGLQVVVYALFLRSDWHYLFLSSGKGLVGRGRVAVDRGGYSATARPVGARTRVPNITRPTLDG